MVTTYDKFVQEELPEFVERFCAGRGHAPNTGDLAHFVWQRLVEGRELKNWLAQAGSNTDVPWVIDPGVTDPTPEEPTRPFDSGVAARRPRTDFLGTWDCPLLMWGGMRADQRQDKFGWMREHGYNMIPLAVHNDYPRFPQWHWDWWMRPTLMKGALIEILESGFVPWVVLHPKAGWSVRTHLEHVTRIWDTIDVYAPAVMWGWEINDLGGEWANGTHQLMYLNHLSRIIGERPLYVHFTPERWAGWPGFDGEEQNRDEVDWLRHAKAVGATGLAYQESPDKLEDDVLARMLTIPSPHGWSPGIAGRVVDGAGLDFVAFEFSRDEARHARLVRFLADDPRVSGWC